MRTVKYPNLPTVPAGERQVIKFFGQAELDERIRKAIGPRLVEEMANETKHSQTYVLSGGRLLKVWKKTGDVQLGCTTNRQKGDR